GRDPWLPEVVGQCDLEVSLGLNRVVADRRIRGVGDLDAARCRRGPALRVGSAKAAAVGDVGDHPRCDLSRLQKTSTIDIAHGPLPAPLDASQSRRPFYDSARAW